MTFFLYAVKNFIRFFFILLSAYLTIFITIVIINSMKQWPQGTSYISIFKMHFCQLPYLLVQFSPLASLGSSVIVFYNLGRSSEMISLLSFGYSPYRLIFPSLLSGALLTIFVLFVSEKIVPKTSKISHRTEQSLINRKQQKFIKNLSWFKDGNSIYSYGSYSPTTKVFYNFHIISVDESQKVREIKRSERVFYKKEDKTWHSRNTKTSYYSEKEEEVETQINQQEIIPLKIDPKLFLQERGPNDTQSLSNLGLQIFHKNKVGSNSINLVTAWHSKLAYILVNFLFIFSGFNLIFIDTYRQKKSIFIFLPYILLAIFYWSFFITLKSLAQTGIVPPLVGAWLTNFLLLLFVIFQFQHSKDYSS